MLEVERVGEGIKSYPNENTINFNFDSATLTPTAKTNLDKLTLFSKTTRIPISMFTDIQMLRVQILTTSDYLKEELTL